MYELILGDEGTVVLQADAIKNCTPTRVTGWTFKVGSDPSVLEEHGTGQGRGQGERYGRRACQKNGEMTTGNHKVFNAGKLAERPKLETVEDLENVLVVAGYCNIQGR